MEKKNIYPPRTDQLTMVHPSTLLFTSMGNRADVLSSWILPSTHQSPLKYSIDIWVFCYQSPNSTLEKLLQDSQVTYYNLRKGSKFQNLAYAYQNYPERFQKYQYIMVLDDDLKITSLQLQTWIDIHHNYKLSISQPSFDYSVVQEITETKNWTQKKTLFMEALQKTYMEGATAVALEFNGDAKKDTECPQLQISWESTRTQRGNILHWTNFIEMTAPLFSHSTLLSWLPDFITDAPNLSGWGTDLYYMLTLGQEDPFSYAVIDKLSIQNPTRDQTNKHQGMTSLISKSERKKQWEKIRVRKGWKIDTYPIKQTGHVDESHNKTTYSSSPIIVEHATVKIKK